MTLPPVIGIALTTRALEDHLDWILADQRDLEIQDFAEVEVLTGDWRPLAERTRARLAGFSGRLGIHGPFYGFSVATTDPGVRAVVQARMDQGLDVCAALGATQMVIHSPFTTWDAHNMDAVPGGRPRRIAAANETLAPAVRRAEALGVTLVLETIEDRDPGAWLDLVRSFGSPAVRASLDTGHAHYAHCATGAPPVDYFVRAAGPLLDHVHVQDADGYADRHWQPGLGTVNWDAVFAAIAEAGITPRLVLELDDIGRSRAGAAWLAARGLVR
jgi:sugar phosphate isomerase/epimerase